MTGISVFPGDSGSIGHEKGNAAARERTVQGSWVLFCDHYSTAYSVKGDRIRAAMQIAARPGFGRKEFVGWEEMLDRNAGKGYDSGREVGRVVFLERNAYVLFTK